MAKLTARGLTRCYVAALFIIAMLSIASHLMLTYTLRTNEGSAAIINMSGRQRMLTQRIGTLALELDKGDRTALQPLNEAINQLENNHKQLIAISRMDLPNKAIGMRLKDAYFGSGRVDRMLHDFVRTARRIATTNASRSAGDHDANMKALLAWARSPLLAGLDHVVAIHQAASEERVRLMERLQWGILGVVLSTLLIEGLFIFRPMVMKSIQYVQHLMTLADHDYLTGLINRRAFYTQARAEIERSRRRGHSLALLLIDVDRFKSINDEHGHLAGDDVLVSLAMRLTSYARIEDLIGRVGGEEFAILLPETRLAAAAQTAERLRRMIARQPIEAQGKHLDVTVSIGISTVPLNAQDPLTAALQTADHMLYRAKEAGRDCVWPKITEAIAEPEPPVSDYQQSANKLFN